ncbi:LysM domain-containing protein [Metarhizium guizhouense ARSEF 977]|uniref:LysM domain-containing protein n=1 Tax=Metarhizium guizhouense (strain ARSEF 977) TaxID=1276136 RepID=A0A0B4H7L6_METGA|nr:LysM domain-containing protein [Metarhizium guizhouense ARSEF 977]
MKTLASILAVLAASLAEGYLVSPPGTPAPGATKDCSAWVQQSLGQTCASIESAYGMSSAKFQEWNPSVTQLGAGCNLIQSLYYCVQINFISNFVSSTTFTSTVSSSSSSTTTRTTTSAGNGITTPTPTQGGMATDCNKFYKVQSGDTCQIIVDKYGTFTLSDFYRWNAAVGLDCHSLWAGYYVCVAVPGSPTTKPPPSGPSPTQAGIIQSCSKYYQAASGDTCQGILDKFQSFSLSDFYTWNPAVKADCTGLWAGYYYCVGIPISFHARALYHADCTGALYNEVTIQRNTDGLCLDTNCQAASLNLAAAVDRGMEV